MFELSFNVNCQTHSPEEIVCVIGSRPELGSWNPDGAIQMQNVRQNIWSTQIQIDDDDDFEIFYRYCTCVVVSSGHAETGQKLIVRKWETGIEARKIRPNQVKRIENFGQITSLVDKIQNGWLTHQESFKKISVQFEEYS